MIEQTELERLKAEADAAEQAAWEAEAADAAVRAAARAAVRAAAWAAQKERFLEIVGARGNAE